MEDNLYTIFFIVICIIILIISAIGAKKKTILKNAAEIIDEFSDSEEKDFSQPRLEFESILSEQKKNLVSHKEDQDIKEEEMAYSGIEENQDISLTEKEPDEYSTETEKTAYSYEVAENELSEDQDYFDLRTAIIYLEILKRKY